MRAVDDSIPVDADEIVLRLINLVYYRPHLPITVQPEAFRPTAHDSSGLSVFRERFIAAPDRWLSMPAEKSYQVARLSVRDLLMLGLSVRPDPIDGKPGHAIIPEINTADYAADKLRWKLVQVRLAELASKSIATT